MKQAPKRFPDESEMSTTIFEYNLTQKGGAHFLLSTVLTLKIHKNGLEKNCRHLQIISLPSRGTLTHPESPSKVPFPTSSDIFFYRLRKMGSFEVLLVFFSTFSFQSPKYPTLMHQLASWVNLTSKTHFHGSPKTSQVPPGQISVDSEALNFEPI